MDPVTSPRPAVERQTTRTMPGSPRGRSSSVMFREKNEDVGLDDLFHAVINRDSSLVHKLLQFAPEQVFCKDADGNTALCHAAMLQPSPYLEMWKNRKVVREIVKHLIEFGSEIEHLNAVGKTPLDLSIHGSNIVAAKLLMNAGAKRKDRFETMVENHLYSKLQLAKIPKLSHTQLFVYRQQAEYHPSANKIIQGIKLNQIVSSRDFNQKCKSNPEYLVRYRNENTLHHKAEHVLITAVYAAILNRAKTRKAKSSGNTVDLSLIRAIIEKDPTMINLTDCQGKTALDHVIDLKLITKQMNKNWFENAVFSVAQFLIDRGAHKNSSNEHDNPLHRAIIAHNAGAIRCLIRNNAVLSKPLRGAYEQRMYQRIMDECSDVQREVVFTASRYDSECPFYKEHFCADLTMYILRLHAALKMVNTKGKYS